MQDAGCALKKGRVLSFSAFGCALAVGKAVTSHRTPRISVLRRPTCAEGIRGSVDPWTALSRPT